MALIKKFYMKNNSATKFFRKPFCGDKMKNNYELEKFVRDTLGCGCPQEVFNKIEYDKKQNGPWERRINVGDRLLVYFINVDAERNIPKKITAAMESGVTERDNNKFNRFRLVVVTSNHHEISKLSEQTFCESKLFDEKTHLHFVSEDDIQALDCI
ncbi:hypothetical protein [uncultured Desulfobacter sp.]|uniref:hypothetical protein n=1 Tax=uncultured Desulfobacter sp. TaxID=240139 RepID=UPI0029F56ED7|nr:hypothetical protein [uncultured Desulfobacter sp.]